MFNKEFCQILRLSDEVLLMIFQYLSTSDLIRLLKTCNRFRKLCLDRKLMTALVNPPDDYETLSCIFNECLQRSTTQIQIMSANYTNRGYRCSLCPSLLFNITPTLSSLPSHKIPRGLTHLSLIRQRLDASLISNITMFPKTLKYLNLSYSKFSKLTEQSHWFRGMSENFQVLEALILKHCDWVSTHALMAISKCSKLELLDMDGCDNVGDSIPYTALACLHGFPNLRILNLNNTDLRDSDFHSFSKIPSLEEFHFGKYNGSNHLTSVTDRMILTCFTNGGLENVRVMDISGCYLHEADNNLRFTALQALFALNNCKLKTVYAYEMPLFPKVVIQEINRLNPQVEIIQSSDDFPEV